MRTSMAAIAVVALGAGVFAQQSGSMPMKQGDMKSMPAKPMMTTQQKITMAMRAAPPEISSKATIVEMNEKDMSMNTLRAGTNGWTCMTSTGQPSPQGQEDPMCMDKAFMQLISAYMSKGEPKLTEVATAYMLMGDKGASNTDPYAEGPTATNNWIVSPAHIMIAVPDPKALDMYPTDPHAGGPWVMWKGTKYAHLMVPTAPMPKMTAMTK